MGNIDKDGLTDDIERQIQIAPDEASLVLFLVDAQTGLTEHDRMVAPNSAILPNRSSMSSINAIPSSSNDRLPNSTSSDAT